MATNVEPCSEGELRRKLALYPSLELGEEGIPFMSAASIDKAKKNPVVAHSSPIARKKTRWDRYTSRCVDCSNASNIGIVLQQVFECIKFFRGMPFIEMIVISAEASIYGFKSLYHLLFLAYAAFSTKDPVEYRKYWHKLQTLGDVVCLTLFTLTILCLTGVIASTPLGWAAGFIGVAINVYFDYYYQSKQLKKEVRELREELVLAKQEYEMNLNWISHAEQKYLEIVHSKTATEAEREQAVIQYRQAVALKKEYLSAKEEYLAVKHEYDHLANSTFLYSAVLVGLVFLLLLGPLSPICQGIGIAVLVCLNLGRAMNYFFPRVIPAIKAKFGIKNPDEELLENPKLEKIAEVEDKPALTGRNQEFEAKPHESPVSIDDAYFKPDQEPDAANDSDYDGGSSPDGETKPLLTTVGTFRRRPARVSEESEAVQRLSVG